MGKSGFGKRRSKLEDAFFAERDKELLQALREKAATAERKKALADATGIHDENLIEQLDQLDFSGETLAALSLVPLVVVAWSDGSIEDKERQAVLEAAEQRGIEKDHIAHELLERWLKQKPDAKLLEVWKGYATALMLTLSPPAAKALREDLMDRARAVALAAGGFLGLGNKISKAEQAVLDELEKAMQ